MSYPTYEHHRVFADITAERTRQDAKWGEQNHPDGTKSDKDNTDAADRWKIYVNAQAREGTTNWIDVLFEEAFEAAAETDLVKLRAEVVQIAAVAVAWLEAIDRRMAAAPLTVGEAIIALIPGAEGAGVKP